MVDAGDIACNPFDIREAIGQIEHAAAALAPEGQPLVALGGDHTIALPLLRAVHRRHGPVALVHFDAHLDTWPGYFGAEYTHGSPFRRAAEEGLFVPGHSAHVGIPVPSMTPLTCTRTRNWGSGSSAAPASMTPASRPPSTGCVSRSATGPCTCRSTSWSGPRLRPRYRNPGGGGASSRELMRFVRGLAGTRLVGADIVEVAPAYDHAEITGVAAANLAYEFCSLLAGARA